MEEGGERQSLQRSRASVGGGAGASSRGKCFISMDRGDMCLFIIGPRVNGLKGVTTHHREELQSALAGLAQ